MKLKLKKKHFLLNYYCTNFTITICTMYICLIIHMYENCICLHNKDHKLRNKNYGFRGLF